MIYTKMMLLNTVIKIDKKKSHLKRNERKLLTFSLLVFVVSHQIGFPKAKCFGFKNILACVVGNNKNILVANNKPRGEV